MKDFTFFLKLLGLTIVVVCLTQIRVGEHSVEMHAMSWVQTSMLAQPLNGVADGAAKVIRDVTNKVHAVVDRSRNKRKAGDKKPSRAFRWFSREEPESAGEVTRD